jgi:hypothetical protein
MCPWPIDQRVEQQQMDIWAELSYSISQNVQAFSMKTDIADQVSNLFAEIDRQTQAFQTATGVNTPDVERSTVTTRASFP